MTFGLNQQQLVPGLVFRWRSVINDALFCFLYSFADPLDPCRSCWSLAFIYRGHSATPIRSATPSEARERTEAIPHIKLHPPTYNTSVAAVSCSSVDNMAHSLSPQPEQPRRVSFSNELPRLQMPEGRSITPARRAYHRSPFPAANETVDYFDDNTSSTPSQPETPTSPDSLHSMHIKHDSIGDPFMGDSTDPPITPPRSKLISAKLMPALPRLDFAESTPIISRGTFTPRPIRQSYSPSRVLGRQISLQNLAATDDGGSSEDEFEDALESFHSSTSVIIETDVAREAVGGTDSRVVELSADDAAVELELDL